MATSEGKVNILFAGAVALQRILQLFAVGLVHSRQADWGVFGDFVAIVLVQDQLLLHPEEEFGGLELYKLFFRDLYGVLLAVEDAYRVVAENQHLSGIVKEEVIGGLHHPDHADDDEDHSDRNHQVVFGDG